MMRSCWLTALLLCFGVSWGCGGATKNSAEAPETFAPPPTQPPEAVKTQVQIPPAP
jgi:hypothetical protein